MTNYLVRRTTDSDGAWVAHDYEAKQIHAKNEDLAVRDYVRYVDGGEHRAEVGGQYEVTPMGETQYRRIKSVKVRIVTELEE